MRAMAKLNKSSGLPFLVAKVHLLDALGQVLDRRQVVDLGPDVALEHARRKSAPIDSRRELVGALNGCRSRPEANLGDRL